VCLPWDLLVVPQHDSTHDVLGLNGTLFVMPVVTTRKCAFMSNRITLRNNHQSDDDSSRRNASNADHKYEFDLVALTRLLLKRRKWIIGVVAVVGFLTATVMLITPNSYTSTAVILPSGETSTFSALSAMTGIGASLGLDSDNSSMLYPTILESNLIRDSLLVKRYEFSFDSEQMNMSMPEYFGFEDPDKLRMSLGGMTSVSNSARTGEITVAVESMYPELSQLLVQQYLKQLENYNLNSRRSEAKERVRYLARELESRSNDLKVAEDSLHRFQSRNRNWAISANPSILRELGRLKRDVEAKTQTYVYLLQEYEVAKLDAQKDVPIVRILDHASLPTRKSGPRRTIIVLLLSFLALGLTILGIIVADLIRSAFTGSNRTESQALASDLEDAFPRASRLVKATLKKRSRETISVDS